ncbi:substrate binding domain-containing protein [Pantoea cypripedii]|uniref:substrate binding domain-containing protein n=1 Tax=Pantoea cypripedii TaxID=55209 RepID=UPI001ABF8003|nr:substrate binding domain-containing protein [Pantoea cypripedii]
MPHAQYLLEGRTNALAELQPVGSLLTGHLRITASSAFGRIIVAPMLTHFMTQHPELKVDLLTTDEQIDIVANGIDIAIRIAPLRDNRLVARRLADNPRVLCASPDYLARQGRPRSLDDLAHHHCLTSTDTTHWSFISGAKKVNQRVNGRFAANSVEVLMEGCRGGLGIANFSLWYAEAAINKGIVTPIVLEDAEPETLGIWAVYPTSRLVPQKVRVFKDAMVDVLTGMSVKWENAGQ